MRETLEKLTYLLNSFQGRLIEKYALVGGLAISAWTEPRATKDIDFIVKVPEHLEGYVKRITEEIQRELKCDVEELKTIDEGLWVLRVKTNITVDLIISILKWQDEIVENSEEMKVFGLNMMVARPEGIIVLKLRANSPQDIIDAERLLGIADINLDKVKALAKRARVDKRLSRLMYKLRSTKTGGR